MKGVARKLRFVLAGALGLVLGAPASAVTALDGRVEVHGYYEAQIRSIVRDFDFSDDWDLTQWWNVLSLEIEANVAPDGIGPFDVISIFGRIEVRYDCVWTGACTMFDSADAYAFSSHGKLPKRLIDARRTGYQGTNYIDDRRHYYDIPFEEISSAPDDRRLRPDGVFSSLRFGAATPIARCAARNSACVRPSSRARRALSCSSLRSASSGLSRRPRGRTSSPPIRPCSARVSST